VSELESAGNELVKAGYLSDKDDLKQQVTMQVSTKIIAGALFYRFLLLGAHY